MNTKLNSQLETKEKEPNDFTVHWVLEQLIHASASYENLTFTAEPTGWQRSRIFAGIKGAGGTISVRTVSISHLFEKEEARSVIFENFGDVSLVEWKNGQPPISANKSTTRLYQLPQYLGVRSDKSMRSKVYGSMVARLCFDTLAEDIVNWAMKNKLPDDWVPKPEHEARHKADDKAYFAEKAKQEAMKNI